MGNLASLDTDATASGVLDDNTDPSTTTVSAINVVACNSGLVTCKVDGKLHWFAYHEQKKTDAIGGVVEAFEKWRLGTHDAKLTHSSTAFGSATDLQQQLRDDESVTEGMRRTKGTQYITIDDFKTKTISYTLDHSDILINDGDWNTYWTNSGSKSSNSKSKKDGCTIL